MKNNIKRKVNWDGIIDLSFIVLCVILLISIAIYDCSVMHHLTIIAFMLFLISIGLIILGIKFIELTVNNELLKTKKNKKA